MSKPTIVCVPGAWHGPEIYEKTLNILKGHGYPTIGLPLPSAGASPPHKSFDGDVKGIRDCLVKLIIEEEKEVVLVMHSYTGMPGAEAPVGLGKKDREGSGRRGGVIRLVFIMAFAMPEGFQPTVGGAQFPEWMQVDMEKELVTVSTEDAKNIFYNDIPSAESDQWAAKLLHQSTGVYSSTISYAAWRYIPSTYVIGTEDRTAMTPEVVSFMITTAKKIEPTAFDVRWRALSND